MRRRALLAASMPSGGEKEIVEITLITANNGRITTPSISKPPTSDIYVFGDDQERYRIYKDLSSPSDTKLRGSIIIYGLSFKDDISSAKMQIEDENYIYTAINA